MFRMYGHDVRVWIVRYNYALGTQYSHIDCTLLTDHSMVCLHHPRLLCEIMLSLYKMQQMLSELQPVCMGGKRSCKPLHGTRYRSCLIAMLRNMLTACDAPVLHRRTLHTCGSPPGQQIAAAPQRTYPVGRLPGSGVFCRRPVHSMQLQHCSRLLMRKTHLQMQTLQQRMQRCRRYAHTGSQLNHILCKQPTVAAMASLHNIHSVTVAWTTAWFSALVTSAAVRMQGTCRHALCPRSVQT